MSTGSHDSIVEARAPDRMRAGERSARHPRWAAVPDATWDDWRWQLRARVTTRDELGELVALTDDERAGLDRAVTRFPCAITPYYLSLFEGPGCPIRRQGIPLAAEGDDVVGDWADPLAEEEHSPVPILSHRYPDRALLYATHTCAVYCRHCTRQRKVGDAESAPARAMFEAAFEYLRRTPQVRDVLVSGGDPLSLTDDRLVEIVASLRAIPSVEVIRLCTRQPVTLPQRITPALVSRLASFHPIWISTHFNHPREGTPEAAQALARLSDAGFPIGNQMVLLRGVNDDVDTVERLNRWLVRNRVRPYYIFQADPVRGTAHLRTPIEVGLAILDGLRGRVSGLAIPQYAVDLPGGGGKITLSPDRLVERREVDGLTRWTFRDVHGREFEYVDPPAGATPPAPVDSAIAAAPALVSLRARGGAIVEGHERG
jgi:lysine 2,3-aminomutase